MLTDLRLNWRTPKVLVAVALPALVVAALIVVALNSDDNPDGALTALRTDAEPPSPPNADIGALNPPPAPLVRSNLSEVLVVPRAGDESAASQAKDAVAEQTSTTDPSTTDSSGTNSTDGPTSTSAPSTSATPDTTVADTGSSTTQPPVSQPPTTPSTPQDGAPCRGDGDFELVMRDDFNGSGLSPAWRQYNSIGNNSFGLRRPAANTVSDGRLIITSRMVDGQLVSGGIAHNYNQQYGKYVFRVRTDDDPNQAMSGVVLTWPQSQAHPRDGENNIYETLALTPDRAQFYSVIHKPFGQRGDQEYFIHRANGAVFQTMTMEWRPDGITITRQGDNPDDREVVAVPETAADLVPDNPHFVAIQLDAWKQQMQGTVRMEVDFIEVHRYCG